MNTIKLGLLVSYEDTIKKISAIPLKSISGKEALKIRKTLKVIQEEIKDFYEARNKYIEENGEPNDNGDIAINKDEDVIKANKFISDMVQQEINISWEPILSEEMIEKVSEHVELTINDLDFMEEAGLVSFDEPLPQEP